MTFNNLQFEPHEHNGFKGRTGYQATAWFANGVGLGVFYGSLWDTYEGEYVVTGFLKETTNTEDLPHYFFEEETEVSAQRVSQILQQIEALPPRETQSTKAKSLWDGDLKAAHELVHAI